MACGAFMGDILAVPAAGGELRQISPNENYLRGLAWLPDSSRILYSSARRNTIPYGTSSMRAAIRTPHRQEAADDGIDGNGRFYSGASVTS